MKRITKKELNKLFNKYGECCEVNATERYKVLLVAYTKKARLIKMFDALSGCALWFEIDNNKIRTSFEPEEVVKSGQNK